MRKDINHNSLLCRMEETVIIPLREYNILKRKARITDDTMLQLELSLRDLESGCVRRVA